MTKLFINTKFTGFHQNTTLISIGLVSECNKTFYAELADYSKTQVDNWIQKNIIDKLLFLEPPKGEQNHYAAIRHTDNPVGNDLYKSFSLKLRGKKNVVKRELYKWLLQFKSVEIWGDRVAYDWVLFCQLFRSPLNIPDNVYCTPFDLCTLFKIKGIDPNVNREEFADIKAKSKKHNALWDAKIIKECYYKALIIKNDTTNF